MQNNHKIRNPIVRTPKGNLIKTIGDAHMGQVFKNDVPLNRRGDYEAYQISVLDVHMFGQLPEECNPGNTLRCQVGDWFHKATVPASVVVESYKLCQEYDDTQEIALAILSGNHDDSKNITEKTSWDLLSLLTDKLEKVIPVKDWKIHEFENGEQVLLIGWNVTTSAGEALLDARHEGYNKITTVVCHLDKASFGNEDNVIPYELFAENGIQMVISGHEHKPYHFYESGMEIIGTGSLLPYSHGDVAPEDDIFLTFKSVAELNEYLEEHPDTSTKHIRVYVTEDDEIPELDAFSVKILKKEALELDEEAVTEVVIDSYNPKEIWQKTAADNALEQDTAEKVWSEIMANGSEE